MPPACGAAPISKAVRDLEFTDAKRRAGRRGAPVDVENDAVPVRRCQERDSDGLQRLRRRTCSVELLHRSRRGVHRQLDSVLAFSPFVPIEFGEPRPRRVVQQQSRQGLVRELRQSFVAIRIPRQSRYDEPFSFDLAFFSAASTSVTMTRSMSDGSVSGSKISSARPRSMSIWRRLASMSKAAKSSRSARRSAECSAASGRRSRAARDST